MQGVGRAPWAASVTQRDNLEAFKTQVHSLMRVEVPHLRKQLLGSPGHAQHLADLKTGVAGVQQHVLAGRCQMRNGAAGPVGEITVATPDTWPGVKQPVVDARHPHAAPDRGQRRRDHEHRALGPPEEAGGKGQKTGGQRAGRKSCQQCQHHPGRRLTAPRDHAAPPAGPDPIPLTWSSSASERKPPWAER